MIVSKRGYSVTVGDGGSGEISSTFQPQTAVIASLTAFLRLVVAAPSPHISEELVALESLVEMVMIWQVAAVPVQGPTALT